MKRIDLVVTISFAASFSTSEPYGNRLLQQVCDPDKKRGRRRKGNGNQRKCRRSNRH